MQALPEDWSRAIAVVAHPDDLEYGMASAIARFTAAGKELSYVLATSGEAGIAGMAPELARPLREDEERASAAAVGVAHVEFLGFPDGTLEYGLPLRRAIAGAIRRLRPEVAFGMNFELTWGGGTVNHADHRAVGLARRLPGCRQRLGLPRRRAALVGDERRVRGGHHRSDALRRGQRDARGRRGVALGPGELPRGTRRGLRPRGVPPLGGGERRGDGRLRARRLAAGLRRVNRIGRGDRSRGPAAAPSTGAFSPRSTTACGLLGGVLILPRASPSPAFGAPSARRTSAAIELSGNRRTL